MSRITRALSTALTILFVGLSTLEAAGQTRRMEQDPALDNLKHPPGTETAAAGTLGDVRKAGEGRRTVLLIPGLGFGASIWTDFMERHKSEFTMYAITLPGFAGTKPLAMPSADSTFADVPWTKSALEAIGALFARERIDHVTIVAHWALAAQIALRLALDQPDRVDAVVLVAGPLKSYYEGIPNMKNWTPEQRAKGIEALSQKWFKTVTRPTWDDNNFM